MTQFPHTPKIPAAFDVYALEAAKRIAAVDRHRLKGGECQYVAMLQEELLAAMLHARAHLEGTC